MISDYKITFLLGLILNITLFYVTLNIDITSRTHRGADTNVNQSKLESILSMEMICTSEDVKTTTRRITDNSVAETYEESVVTTEPLQNEVVKYYSRYVVERREWDPTFVSGPCRMALYAPVTNIFVSESGTDNCYTYRTCLDIVAPILTSGMQYNFVIAGDGTIFVGLSWNCTRINSESIHILFTGNSNSRFSKTMYLQYDMLKLLIKANVVTGNISPEYTVGPICCFVQWLVPYKDLYQRLSKLDHFMTECDGPNFCGSWTDDGIS